MGRTSPMTEEDEAAIRAKLRESGWEKKKRESEGAQEKPTAEADAKASSKEKADDDDRRKRSARGSRGSGSSRRSRSRARDSRRSSRSDRNESSRRRGSSRRSASSSRSRSARRTTSSRRRGASRSASRDRRRSKRGKSRSASAVRSRSKKDSEKRSRSRSLSADSKKRKSSVDEKSKPSEDAKKEDTKHADVAMEDAEKPPKKAEESKDAASSSHRKSSRKSSRRSHSRSASRSSRRRRRRSSRSRSRSPSRSRRSRRGSSRSRSSGRRSTRDRRHRSRSHSTSRRHKRSSSKDPKRRDANSSPEPHEFPPAAAAPSATGDAVAGVNPSITQLMQQYPTLSLQDIIAKMQASNVTMAAAVSMKPAREMYVGNLPPNVTGPQLQEFLGTIIQQVGLSLQPGNPILATWISTDGHFAFCEMRTVEECNLALMLNQLPLLGQPLKFGRPKSFMGPPQPMPVLSSRTQTALVNLGCTPNPVWFATAALPSGALPSAIPASMASMPLASTLSSSLLGAAGAASGLLHTAAPLSNRLIMMNIPVVLDEDQIKELVEPFGALKSFVLVKDTAGVSTGSALFEYQDESVAATAVTGLDGLDLGGAATLSVRRAPQDAAAGALPPVAPDLTSPCVKLANMVSVDELNDDEEYNDLKEDVEEECKRFGTVLALEIPRPKDGAQAVGVGSIFVRFQDKAQATAALKALSGRKFGGNIVQVTYFPEVSFDQKAFA